MSVLSLPRLCLRHRFACFCALCEIRDDCPTWDLTDVKLKQKYNEIQRDWRKLGGAAVRCPVKTPKGMG